MKTIRYAAAAALTAITLAGGVFATSEPASAVVYCRAVGVPHGCIVRPARPVVYCKTVGVPKGCVMR